MKNLLVPTKFYWSWARGPVLKLKLYEMISKSTGLPLGITCRILTFIY